MCPPPAVRGLIGAIERLHDKNKSASRLLGHPVDKDQPNELPLFNSRSGYFLLFIYLRVKRCRQAYEKMKVGTT